MTKRQIKKQIKLFCKKNYAKRQKIKNASAAKIRRYN